MTRLTICAVLALSFLPLSPVLAKPASVSPLTDVTVADFTIGAKPGNPTFDLPSNMRLLSAFGERPVFSPDGTRIAFIGASYGDAYEMDLKTGAVRNLTAHAPHNGFLRVHYLADGNFILMGPRLHGKTREETRNSHIELFWLDAQARRAPVALNRTAFEGIAVSPRSNLLAWSEIEPRADSFAQIEKTKVMVATVAMEGGRPVLRDERQVLETTAAQCLVEPQDFLPGDSGLTLPCYYVPFLKKPRQTDVVSVDFKTGKMTTYPTPAALYGEVEGLFPDGKSTLVECSGDRSAGMDICILELKADRPRYTRITRIMDYGRWKYGNPVVSPDGRSIAMQIGSADVVDAGVGQGIVMLAVQQDGLGHTMAP